MTIPSKKLAEASRYARVNNANTQQTVSSGPAIVQRVVVSNSAAAVGSITVADGATVLGVWEVPVNDTISIELRIACTTSVLCTPSATTLDCLFVLD